MFTILNDALDPVSNVYIHQSHDHNSHSTNINTTIPTDHVHVSSDFSYFYFYLLLLLITTYLLFYYYFLKKYSQEIMVLLHITI